MMLRFFHRAALAHAAESMPISHVVEVSRRHRRRCARRAVRGRRSSLRVVCGLVFLDPPIVAAEA